MRRWLSIADVFGRLFARDRRSAAIVGGKSPLLRVENGSFQFWGEHFRLGESAAEGGYDGRVLRKAQLLGRERGLGGREYRVVGARHREAGLAVAQQELGGVQAFFGQGHQGRLVARHIVTPSLRTFR